MGSIVEYQYLLALPLHIVDQISSWPMASELFTLKEELRFRPFQGLVEVPTERGRFNAKSQVSYTYLNQVKAATPEKQGDTMKLELDNVAPFTREDYMPPEGDYQPAIFFYYGGRETASPDQFWEKWGKILSEWSEGFIGNFAAVRDKSLQLIGNETDPEAKLRKLYAGAQEIRNLSYERDRTAQELKAEGIKENRSVADVLSHGYGTSSDVNRLFVAVARAAGFQSHELRVSDRLERSFSKLVLSLAQLDHQAAEVTVGSNVMVLDPGTKYCPFGLLRWQETGVQALRLSSTAAEFITTPIAVKSVVDRSAKVELLADGTLRGELTVVMDGQEALEHRLEALHTDERGRAKTLEDETTAMLPSGSVVKLLASAGWDSGAGPVTARFSLELPNFAASTGKRLISPSLLLATLQKEMFTTDFRRYPISFMYPFDETDEVSIKLPIGYLPEVLPYRRRATLSYAGYETASSLKDHTLSTSRKLHLDGMLFPPEQFGELKGFFAVVLAGDAGQAILQLDSGEAAGRSSY